jgi:ubiquinone/menaquinone biosynthesis C-methylase UbiE
VDSEAIRHNQAAYDEIADLYAQRQVTRGLSFPDLHAAFAARLPPAANLADLGCGPAADGASFAAAGHRVAGIDRSAGMLAAAVRVLPGRLVQADLRSIPLAGASLDGIWCCAALLHVPLDQTMVVLNEIRRVLRPGGLLALVTALGDGARLEPVPYAPDARRWFFYRGASHLSEQLGAAGLHILTTTEEPASRHWFKVLAAAWPPRPGEPRAPAPRLFGEGSATQLA